METLLSIAGPSGGYFVVKRVFDFGDIERELEDREFEEDTYRNHRMWEDERETSTSLFPDAGLYVYRDEDAVKGVLRGIARDEGLMDEEAGLRRAIDASGDGLIRLCMDCDALGQHADQSLLALGASFHDRGKPTYLPIIHIVIGQPGRFLCVHIHYVNVLTPTKTQNERDAPSIRRPNRRLS